MPRHFTKEYVANLTVRIFLSEIGRKKWQKVVSVNEWNMILDKSWDKTKVLFGYCCAYCGTEKNDKLERDHLIPINREKGGLNYPGNIIPSCKKCHRSYNNLEWREKLKKICEERDEIKQYEIRKSRILNHHLKGDYKYPKLSKAERENISDSAKKLYRKIVKEIDIKLKNLQE